MKVKNILKCLILTTFQIFGNDGVTLYDGYIENTEISDIPPNILELEVKYITVGEYDELLITVL